MRIKFQDRFGNLKDEPPGMPVVNVCITFDKLFGSGPRTTSIEKTFTALIDTGASICCIDPSVLLANNLPVEGQMLVYGVNSTSSSDRHVAHIFFPDEGIQFETDVVTTKLRENGGKHDAIIGMLLIEQGCLILDYKKKDFRLEFRSTPQ